MDNHHVNMYSSQMSCGIAELSNIGSDVKKVLYAIATNLYHPAKGSPYAVVMWSDLAEKSNGQALADAIDDLGEEDKEPIIPYIGDLESSGFIENPKTGNLISFWALTVNHEKFKAWYVKERVERAKKL